MFVVVVVVEVVAPPASLLWVGLEVLLLVLLHVGHHPYDYLLQPFMVIEQVNIFGCDILGSRLACN